MAVLLGRQTPRFELRPDCWSCAAVEAIEFYESLGPRLDPWQKHVLNAGLGEDQYSDWAAPEVGLVVQRQNGKGGVTEAVELTGLFVWGERVIIHTAHLIDTSKAAFRRTVELVEGSDDLTRRVKRVNRTNGEEAIELLDGAVLKFRTRTGRGGRGLTGERLTFDEAQELVPEQMEALVPTILARPNPQIWYTATVPKLAGQFLTVLRRRAKAGDPGLAYCEWGVDRGADLDDPAVMAEANPAYGIRVTPRTLAIARGILGEDGYGRECAGIWPVEAEDEWRLIGADEWMSAQRPDSQIVGRPAYGVYVPPDRSYTAIAAAGVASVGGRHIEVTGDADQVLDYRPGTRWVVGRLQELERHRPTVLVIDDKALADEAEAAGLTVHRASVADVVTGCQLLFDGIAGPDAAARDVHHIGQPDLTDAAAGAVKRDVGGSWAWARRDLSVEVAPIAAGSLALFGHCTPRVWRRDRTPAAAFVDVAARPQARPGRRLAAAVVEDVTAVRLREQLERDLAVRS